MAVLNIFMYVDNRFIPTFAVSLYRLFSSKNLKINRFVSLYTAISNLDNNIANTMDASIFEKEIEDVVKKYIELARLIASVPVFKEFNYNKFFTDICKAGGYCN